MYWIYDIPSYLSAAIIGGFFVALNLLGMLGVRKALRGRSLPEADNALVGYFMAGGTALYGITLGLIAVGTWSNFSEVEKTVGQEAAAVAALYRDVKYYPEPYATQLTSAIREYVRFVIEDAWPLQRRGQQPNGGAVRLTGFQEIMARFQPQTPGETVMQAEALHQLSQVSELRRQRVQSVTTGLPVLLYYVIVFGGLINIVLTWFLNSNRFSLHLVTSTLFSALLGSLIFLIVIMDNPFRGELSVTPDAFKGVMRSLMGG